MQQEAHKMPANPSNFPTNRSEIAEARMSHSAATTDEMRDIVGHAVNARRDRGQSEAVFQAARELGLSSRRVLAILRGEVGRVWADELDTARHWYAAFCQRQAAKLAAEAADYTQRAEALKERLR
jgi:hypothetical protein